MKLKTMLAVVAGALGLCASAAVELPDGVSFEQEAKVVQPSEITETKEATWAASDAENTTLEVKAYGEEASYGYSASEGNGRLSLFGDGQDSYLSVKTKIGNPVTRAQDVAMNGSGVYFDSLVKFTACDEEPTTEYSGAKLVVYVLEDEANAETNLIVKAGNGTYVIKENVNVEAWHRLTIKSFKTIKASGSVPGFAIFLDGAAVRANEYTAPEGLSPTAKAFADNKNLFVTLDTDSEDFETFKGVGFDGQGAIDDVAFSATAPVTAAEDPAFCTIKIGDKVAKFSVGGVEYTADAVVVATVNPMTVSNIEYKPGYFGPSSLEVAAGGEIELDTNAKAVVAKIGDDNYESIEAALDAAGTDAVIVLQKDVAAKATIAVNKAVTIDLNGKTVTAAAGVDVFTIGAEVIFDDNGETGKVVAVQAEGADGDEIPYAYAIVEGEGESVSLTIKGGTFAGKAEDDDFGMGRGSTVVITGGWFLNDPSGWLEGTDYEAAMDETHENYYKVTKVEKKGWAIYLAGAGTLEDPYEIADAGDLLDLATNLNKTADFETAGLYFKQTAEIDLTGITWEGIGAYVGENSSDNRLFCGVYDGNKQTVKNVTFAKKEYNGLFGNLGGAAQIKDLTITVAGIASEGTATSYGFGVAAGYAMGTDVLLENITVNPATDGQASIQGTHNMGGIGARLAGKITLKNCTNNLDISTTYSKIGGMCAIASQRDAAGAIVFEGCVNNGTITGVGLTKGTTEAGSDGCAGILAYIQDGSSTDPKAGNKPVSFIDCVNNGTLQHTGDTGTTKACIASILGKAGGQVYQTVSGNVVKADYLAVASGSAMDGLYFATVKDGVATLVANSAAVANANLKVMAAGAPEITLANIGDQITLDTTLATATVTTTAENAKVVQNGNVYKVEKAGGDIPVDPAKDITDDTKPADIGLDPAGPFKDAGKTELVKLATWANKAGKKAADINGTSATTGIKFDANGVPTTEMAEAYLLDCGVDGVAAAKEAFKFNADDLAAVLADPTSLTTLNGNSYNGTIQVKAFSDAACKTPAEGDLDAKFYKAVLVK